MLQLLLAGAAEAAVYSGQGRQQRINRAEGQEACPDTVQRVLKLRLVGSLVAGIMVVRTSAVGQAEAATMRRVALVTVETLIPVVVVVVLLPSTVGRSGEQEGLAI
mgnify:CR=1 FL=1